MQEKTIEDLISICNEKNYIFELITRANRTDITILDHTGYWPKKCCGATAGTLQDAVNQIYEILTGENQ